MQRDEGLRALPRSSTRALLFTDIEGSTKLVERLGDGYSEVLDRHQVVVRDAISAFGGIEHGTEGDSFFVTFDSVTDAVAAAVRAQRGLMSAQWPDEGVVRVRMGIHVGEVTTAESGLVGIAIHHAARVAATSHGGQIVVSDAVRSVAGRLPAGIGLVSLGRYVLRDVGVTELHQVTHEDLSRQFPPLRCTPAVVGNIAPPLTSLIGRVVEIGEIAALVSRSRLVTLTGAGGAGKTRLAIEVASGARDSFDDGVWLVELAPLVDPGSIAPAIASALGVRVDLDRAPIDVLVDALRDRRQLLLLDNCEHVLDAAAEVVERLLRECRQLSVIATSRESLRLPGEVVYRVPSLGYPAPDCASTEIARHDSVNLFLERARERGVDIDPDDDDLRSIGTICRRLDGIPLAIELAAARTSVLSVHQILEQLADRFRLLTGGSRTVLPRHQTLRALIDWSYHSLPDRERLVLDRVSVFAGGFEIAEAKAALAAAGLQAWDVIDAIDSLVERSLIHCDDAPRVMRYRLLETVRQYAGERLLDRGDAVALHAREAHLDVFIDFALRARAQLRGPEQRIWLARLEAEVDNLRTALTFGIDNDATRERCARLANALVLLHWRAGVLGAELRAVHESLADDPGVADEIRVEVLDNLGQLVYRTSSSDARVHIARALTLARALGDVKLICAEILSMAWLELTSGATASALAMAEEALQLASARDDGFLMSWAHGVIGLITCEQDLPAAKTHLEAALALDRAAGNHINCATTLGNLGVLELSAGNFVAAHRLLTESRAEVIASGTTTISEAPYNLGLAAYGLGEMTTARVEFAEALRIDLVAGDWRRVAFDVLGAALIAPWAQRDRDAATLHAAANHLIEGVGSSFEPFLQRWAADEIDRLRSRIGEERFVAASEAGASANRAEAVALAQDVLAG